MLYISLYILLYLTLKHAYYIDCLWELVLLINDLGMELFRFEVKLVKLFCRAEIFVSVKKILYHNPKLTREYFGSRKKYYFFTGGVS